jgi:hypothetical protein
MYTVRLFASKNSFEYRVINNVPEWFTGSLDYWSVRTLSEWIKLEILSIEKYSLIVDWDIELFNNFKVEQYLSFDQHNLDSMVYNHDRLDTFNNIINFLKNENRNNYKESQLILYKGIMNEIITNKIKYKIFDNYVHHSHSCLVMSNNLKGVI